MKNEYKINKTISAIPEVTIAADGTGSSKTFASKTAAKIVSDINQLINAILILLLLDTFQFCRGNYKKAEIFIQNLMKKFVFSFGKIST